MVGRSIVLSMLLAACAPPVVAQAPAPRVVKAPVAPRGEVEATRLVALPEYLPRALALDATHVYWTTSTDLDGSTWRVSKGGGDPEKLADIAGDCLVVGDELWIGTGREIVALPKAGGVPRKVTEVTGVLALGPDGVYAASTLGGVARIGTTGTITRLTVRPTVSILGGATIVFATEPDEVNEQHYTLWRLDGDVPVPIAQLSERPWHLARQGDMIFVATTTAGHEQAILTVPITGGTPTVLATHMFGISRIVVDGAHVWWGTGDGVAALSFATRRARLYAADPAGRKSRPERHALVADEERLYWLSTDHRSWKSTTWSKLMTAPRPSR